MYSQLCFCNGSNYDYHFIIKGVTEQFEGQFNCFGENTEKYLTFLVPINNEVTRIDKKGGEITKNMSYKLEFIDSARFMASSLSSLVNNLAEGIHKVKLKYSHDSKKCEACGITYKDYDCFLEYTNFRDNLIEYKCLC